MEADAEGIGQDVLQNLEELPSEEQWMLRCAGLLMGQLAGGLAG